MTYEETAALMIDPTLRGRVKVAMLSWASSVNVESPTVPAHNARLRFAAQLQLQPDQRVLQIQPPTCLDPAVQSAGAAITDIALQGAVDTTINQMI